MTGPREPEPELGEIEWLDGGPADPGRRPRIPRTAWYVLIAGVIAAVVIALTVSRGDSTHQASPSPIPTPTPSTPSPTPTPSTSPPSDPPSTGPSVTVRDLGHPLLDVPHGIDLFARDGNTVLRMELATGRITRSSNVDLTANGPVSMVATRHTVLLMAGDPGSGVVIPDGRRPRPMAIATTQQGGTLAPGPDPDHAWLVQYNNRQVKLIGPDGRPTGATMPSGDTPDGTGYLLSHLNGGVYLVRPGSPLQRITSGALLAVGPTRWLTEECDAQHDCTLDAVDRATGVHHVLKPTSDTPDPLGVISPDGEIAATVRFDMNQSSAMLRLNDMATGAVRASIPVTTDQDYTAGPQVWTPDSRWLLTIGPTGRVIAIDRAGHTKALTGQDTVVTQLALRAQ